MRSHCDVEPNAVPLHDGEHARQRQLDVVEQLEHAARLELGAEQRADGERAFGLAAGVGGRALHLERVVGERLLARAEQRRARLDRRAEARARTGRRTSCSSLGSSEVRGDLRIGGDAADARAVAGEQDDRRP